MTLGFEVSSGRVPGSELLQVAETIQPCDGLSQTRKPCAFLQRNLEIDLRPRKAEAMNPEDLLKWGLFQRD